MLRNDWPVEEHGVRPAGKPDECFYCQAAKGTQHRKGCVIRSRTVVVRTIVEHTIDVPEDWDRSIIEFTDGSSCSNNHIQKLNELVDRLNVADRCTCGMLSVEYVRDATEDDEEHSALFVAAQPT